MKLHKLQTLAANLASLGLLLPQTALAGDSLRLPRSVEPPAAVRQSAVHVSDVALRDGGVLIGRVVNFEGAPKPASEVVIEFGQQEIVRTVTDENGVFAAQGLRGGQYTIVTEAGQTTCRCWTANTAPPTARPIALVTQGADVVRGQWGGGAGYGPGRVWLDWMRAHPYITAGTIAAAIAIPLAFADDDWQPSS